MCTVFARVEREGLLIGRSFDWVQYGGNICFLPSHRCYGVNTIGCMFIEQMGEDRAYEGLNQAGLFVAVVALPTKGEEVRVESPLQINSLSMVRYILERASTVDEALYIVKQFTIDYKIKYGWPKVQYFFVDTGHNIGIYEENVHEEHNKLKDREFKLLTNKSVKSEFNCIRYNKVDEILKSRAKLDENKYMDLVSMVHQEGLTAWSTVYDIEQRNFTLCIEGNFKDKYNFELEKCLNQGRFSVDFAELKLNTKVMKRKRNQGYSSLEVF